MTNETLRSYFLGELDERASETIERAVFDRQQIAEQAFAVEAELFEDFTEERLSPREREKFERNYLVTDARRAQFAVSEFLRHEYGSHGAKKALVFEPKQSFWQKLFGFDNFSRRLAFAGFAVLAFLIGGMLFVLWSSKTNAPETTIALGNSEQNAQTKTTGLQTETPTAEINQNLHQSPKTDSTANATNLNLNSTIEKNKQNPVESKKPANVERKPTVSAIATIVLVAGGVRGESAGEQTVKILPSANLVNLKLILPPEADAKKYRAEIVTLDREIVFATEKLSVAAGKNRQINLQIPARRLAALKQYVLFLKDEENSSVAEYFFRVAQDK